MTAYRWQHFLSSTLILAIAMAVTWVSFTEEPADAFLFPRLISVFFITLGIWNFVRAVLGMSKVGTGLTVRETLNFLPGLLIALVFVFFAAKQFGFYATSSIVFFSLYTIYDPVPLRSAVGWVKRIITTALFMTILYGLFALLLKVQTPRGMFL